MNDETTQAAPLDGAATSPATDAPQASPELAKLAQEARMLDGAPAQAESQQKNAVALSIATQNKGELHAALLLARGLVLPIIALKSERKSVMLSAIWTDDALGAIAENGAQVLALHGIALSNLTAGMGPYIGLALSLGPVAIGTVAVLKSKDPEIAERVD